MRAMRRVGRLPEQLRATVDALRTDGRGWILASVSFGWLLGLGIRLVFPAVLPYVRGEFDMGLTLAGLLLSALWIAYALMQFPGGLVADWFGERNVLVLGLVVATAGLGGVIAAPGVAAFFAGTILVGLGVGLYGTTRITVLGDVYPERSGTAIGINQAAGNVGTTVMPPLAGLLAVPLGWRWGFGVVLPLFVGVAVALWAVVPARTSAAAAFDRAGVADSVGALRRAVSHPPVVVVTLAMLLASFTYQGFTGFYPTYLVARKGFDEGAAATLFGLFFATAIVVQPVAGIARDRFGARWTLVAALAVAAAALAALPFVAGLVPLVAVTVLLSSLLAFWPISNAYVVEAVPEDIQGATIGLTRTFYILVGATGSIFVGAAGDRGRFDEAFLVLAALTVVAIGLAIRLSPPDR